MEWQFYLDHGFTELEVLKPIFTAIALLGFHITHPFHTLLMDDATVKKNFMAPFYGWGSIASRLQSHYKEAVYFSTLSSSLQSFTDFYSNEVPVLTKILLKMFAESLEYQKGAIFGFGESPVKDTPQHVAKI